MSRSGQRAAIEDYLGLIGSCVEELANQLTSLAVLTARRSSAVALESMEGAVADQVGAERVRKPIPPPAND